MSNLNPHGAGGGWEVETQAHISSQKSISGLYKYSMITLRRTGPQPGKFYARYAKVT
jgi:hypothetical protein